MQQVLTVCSMLNSVDFPIGLMCSLGDLKSWRIPKRGTAVKILRLEMERSTLTNWLAGPNVTERSRAILQILLRKGDDELSQTWTKEKGS